MSDAFRKSAHLELREIESWAPPEIEDSSTRDKLALRIPERVILPPGTWRELVFAVVAVFGGCLLVLGGLLFTNPEVLPGAILAALTGGATIVGSFRWVRKGRVVEEPRQQRLLVERGALQVWSKSKAEPETVPLGEILGVDVNPIWGGTRAEVVIRREGHRRLVLFPRLPLATAHWIARRLKRYSRR